MKYSNLAINAVIVIWYTENCQTQLIQNWNFKNIYRTLIDYSHCTVPVFSIQVFIEHSNEKVIVVEVYSFVEQCLIV